MIKAILVALPMLFLASQSSAQNYVTPICNAQGLQEGAVISGTGRSVRMPFNNNYARQLQEGKKISCINALKDCIRKFDYEDMGRARCRVTRHYGYVEAPGRGNEEFYNHVNATIYDLQGGGPINPPPPPPPVGKKAVFVCSAWGERRDGTEIYAQAASIELDEDRHRGRNLRPIARRVCKRALTACMYRFHRHRAGHRKCQIDSTLLFSKGNANGEERARRLQGQTLGALGVDAPQRDRQRH